MRSARVVVGILGVLGVCWVAQRAASQATGQAPARRKGIAIVASTVLDGKGGVLHDKRIRVEGGIITAIEGKAYWEGAPVDYDLRGLTVLPGWIDAHVHIAWSFGKDGKNGSGGWTAAEAASQIAANAR